MNRKTWQGLDIFLWIVAEIDNFHCHKMDKGLSPINVGPCTGVRTSVLGNEPVLVVISVIKIHQNNGYSFGVLIITELFLSC